MQNSPNNSIVVFSQCVTATNVKQALYNYFLFVIVLLSLGTSALAEISPSNATGISLHSPTSATAAQTSTGEPTFRNPLREDGGDPFIVVHENNYYLLVSREDRINIIKASSLGGLRTAPEVTVYLATGNVGKVWAPEMHRLDGPNGKRWYIYYTAGSRDNFDNQRTRVLESAGSDPLGTYIEKGRLFDAANDFYAIDGSVFEHQGQLYFLWSGGEASGPTTFASLYIAPMSNPWTLSGRRVQISTPQFDWEKVGAGVNEAPAVLQRNGKIFITYSASWCVFDYKLGMLTATAGSNLLDPAAWRKSPQPVFQGGYESGAFGVGHNSFFRSPDGSEDWLIYHATGSPLQGCAFGANTRSTRAQRLTFNLDGSPNFSAPVTLDTDLALPAGEAGVDNATAIIPGAAYRFINQKSGLCLDVPYGLPFGGVQLQQTNCNGFNPQHWYFKKVGAGFYNLIAQKLDSNLCLDVRNGATTPGAEVQQWYCNDESPQRWRIASQNGSSRIVTEAANLVLDTANASPEVGAQTVTAVQTGSSSQQWKLIRR